MGIDQSPEKTGADAQSKLVCSICETHINSVAEIYKTSCNHDFHRKCIAAHFKSDNKCPRCNAVSLPEALGVTTRGKCKSRLPTDNPGDSSDYDRASTSANAAKTIETASDRLNPGEAMNAIALITMERRLLTSLSEKMSEIIQNSVVETVQRLMITPPQSTSNNTRAQTPIENSSHEVGSVSGIEHRRSQNAGSPFSNRSHNTDLLNRPDKVVHILNGWKLKFSGTGFLTVDNFIYRVEALTVQTLEGNFSVLCKNASVLFEGKANEFYWRYHKSVNEVQWNQLCVALRLQFRQERDDADIEELIRSRKQKNSENFDCFFDSISTLLDQLQHPLSPQKIVRLLRNNLRPEIRHELLNIEIKTVSELRDICRRRENFLEDVKRSQGYVKGTPYRREVSELIKENTEEEQSDSDSHVIEVEAFTLICWNCNQEGHRYQDCIAERRVFCYGCGAPNTYKPDCRRCSKNSKGRTPKSPPKPKASSAQRNQGTMTD